ncbi:MAG: transposase domain-containing protein [Pseudomonadota bacterium]|nr:transposase domain-containing protein [Pseudomonadota bacterium]
MENDFGTSVRPSFEDIEERFRQWRGHRKRGESIPEDLWEGAVSLCAEFTLSKVSRALHLNHATLKKRFLATRSPHIPGSVIPSDFLGDMFMSLIHTCNLGGVNPFDYLVALQKYAKDVFKNPAHWMPWNYQAAFARGRLLINCRRPISFPLAVTQSDAPG